MRTIVVLSRGLEPHGVLENFSVKRFDEIAVETVRGREGTDSLEQGAFAVGVLQGQPGIMFERRDFRNKLLALSERFDEAAIDLIEVVAQRLKRVIRHGA